MAPETYSVSILQLFFDPFNPQIVSKVTTNICKSWENLHIALALILKIWLMSPLATGSHAGYILLRAVLLFGMT